MDSKKGKAYMNAGVLFHFLSCGVSRLFSCNSIEAFRQNEVKEKTSCRVKRELIFRTKAGKDRSTLYIFDGQLVSDRCAIKLRDHHEKTFDFYMKPHFKRAAMRPSRHRSTRKNFIFY